MKKTGITIAAMPVFSIAIDSVALLLVLRLFLRQQGPVGPFALSESAFPAAKQSVAFLVFAEATVGMRCG